MKKTNVLLLSLILLLTVILSACGTEDNNTGSDSGTGSPAGQAEGGASDGNNGAEPATQPAEQPPKPVTLEFWTTAFVDQAQIEAIAERYKAEVAPHVTLKVTYLPFNGIDEKINVSIAANEFPDIYADSFQRLGPLAIKGITAPIDAYINDDFNKGDYTDNGWDLGQIQGQTYLIPINMQPQTLMINRTLFEQAGATDLLPNETTRGWSRQQLAQAAEKIGALGGGVYGFGLAAGASDHDKFIDGFLYSDGDEYTNADYTQITFNSERNVANFDWLINVATASHAMPGVTGIKNRAVLDQFLQGKVAIMAHNAGFYDIVLDGQKNGTAPADMKPMFAHYPTEDGSVGKTFIYGDGIAVKQQADAARMEESAKFVLWLTSGADQAANDALYSLRATPVRQSLIDQYVKDNENKVLLSMPGEVINNIFVINNYPQLRKVWFDQFQPALLNKSMMTAEQALANYEKEAQRLLAQ